MYFYIYWIVTADKKKSIQPLQKANRKFRFNHNNASIKRIRKDLFLFVVFG